EGVSIAVICGLVLGKFLGIFLFSWLCIKTKLAPMPDRSNWKMLASISMLGGIGFTVSLFIANLSFGSMGVHGQDLLNHAKLGIVIGSVLSGVLGFIFLHLTLPHEHLDDSND
ncbi:MAG: Na+/H+ antiporter NhaA, partial [Muribaculaceae bacterium]|nr:Na+/H+ antiporter NhaA [Muribaculaceae bacterium]